MAGLQTIRAQSVTISPDEPSGIRISEHELAPLQPGQVKVRFHAAPISPLDIAVIEGGYPVKPAHSVAGLPIPGYDGVAEVIEVYDTDPQTDNKAAGDVPLAVGDVVIPSRHGLGTWRTHAVLERAWVDRIERPLDLRFAAVLKGAAMPAFFLLEDVVKLQPGDWLVQNAGTSAIAQYVVQLARLRGVRSISVVRDRPAAELEDVRAKLKAVGADEVLTETELDLRKNAPVGREQRRIQLAIDSVFGRPGRALIDALSPGATYVQLGFLGGGKDPLQVDTSVLFGRQINMVGFRSSARMAARSELQREHLAGYLVRLFNAGQLVLPPLGLPEVPWVYNSDATDVDDVGQTAARLTDALAAARGAALGQRKQLIVFSDQA